MSLLTGLISHFKLDETSGNAADSHGANTLTQINSPGSAAGKIGNARTFVSGSTQYFTSAGRVTSGTISQVSASAWIKLTGTQSFPTVCGEWNAGGNQRSWLLTLSSDGTDLRFPHSNNGTATLTIETTGLAINDGNWHFVGVCYNAGSALLHVDGVNYSSTGLPTSLFSSSSPLVLAAANTSTTPAGLLTGTLDEVSVWSRALTADEFITLWNSGNALAYPWTSQRRRSAQASIRSTL